MFYETTDSKNTMETAVYINKVLNNFPYFVIRNEMTSGYDEYKKEIVYIKNRYVQYRCGVRFNTEGTSGDYVPSQLRFRKSANLINKEARFMFSRSPDLVIQSKNVDEDEQDVVEQYQSLLDQVVTKSNFGRKLLQGAKDCLIGGRIAASVEMSEEQGIRINFYNALQFYYETDYGTDVLKKFVSFELVNNATSNSEKRFLVNKYVKENDTVTESSVLYNGSGAVVEEIVSEHQLELDYIPAVIIINDGLLEDVDGVSDMEGLAEMESGYSRLANSDIDSERKGMNPVRYTVDMNPDTTENLPSNAGAYWDLQSNQNIEKAHPSVGTLAPQMNHTESVKTTLDRINTEMHETVDVPNISEETMVGTITSGKALKILYYPLMVRCDEKLKAWIPALEFLARTVIDFAKLEQDYVIDYYNLSKLSDIQITVKVQQHYALLEDEAEAKATDLTEIAQYTRSRKSYLKKWRKEEFPTDEKVEEELMQIAIENTMFDTMSPNTMVQTELDRRTQTQQVDSNLDDVQTQQTLEGDA